MKLKPAVFANQTNKFYRNNIFQQNLLLKALQHTDKIEDLKKIAEFHSKAEVLRTLDKLAIRKEFHNALVNNNLDLNTITVKLKELCDDPSGKIKLGTVSLLLKSLGLDKYEVGEQGTKNWEELLLEIYEKEKTTKKIGAQVIEGKYEVKTPKIPQEVIDKKKETSELEKSIYG